MKQKIIKPGVVRRIAEKIADEGINIPNETGYMFDSLLRHCSRCFV